MWNGAVAVMETSSLPAGPGFQIHQRPSDMNLKSGQRSGLGTKGVVTFMGFESPEVMLWPIWESRMGDEV